MKSTIRIPAITTICLALALALGGRAGAGEERVSGTGYGTTAKPAVTNDPPGEHTSDATEHDVAEGLHFGGVAYYELTQGPRDDDKHAWAQTDYIRWTVHGATLIAEGKLHDSDPAETAKISSEAWGSEHVQANVSAEEGDYGYIRAENRVAFKYSYIIAGNYIGEGSVQLQASAFDIKGKEHTFSLSDQRSENVTTETETKEGFERQTQADVRVYASTGSRGASGGVRGGTSSTETSYSEIHATVTRRFAQAGGDNGSTVPVLVRDSISGRTPLSKDYDVYSDGSVVLRARAGKAPEGETASVLVDLEEFKVQNSLEVYKCASWEPIPPPYPGEPGGPSTPPELPIPDAPVTPPDSDTDTEPERDPPEEGTGDGRSDHVALTDDRDEPTAHGHIRFPHGLSGEPGTLPGSMQVGVSQAAGTDLVFVVDVSPPDLLDLAGRDRITVRAGRQWSSISFHALRAGTALVGFELLDGSGARTGRRFELEVPLTSVADHETTRIWATVAGKPWLPGRGVAVRGLAGTDAGPLVVGRLGFSGYDEEATVVTVETEDPAGILEEAPETVVVGAGETSVALPLALGEAEGTARLRLSHGTDSIEVVVLSRAQGWSSSPLVRVPLGAVAPIPILLDHGERSDRPVEAVVADETVGVIAEPAPQTTLRAGETAWFFRFRGETLGATTVTLASPGLGSIEVPVEVLPPTISIEEGRLEIAAIPPAAEGIVRLWTKLGMRIASIALPEGSEEYLSVEGAGSCLVTLTFTASPEMPTTLSLPIQWEGDTGGPFEVGVLDTLHGIPPSGVVDSYLIEPR